MLSWLAGCQTSILVLADVVMFDHDGIGMLNDINELTDDHLDRPAA